MTLPRTAAGEVDLDVFGRHLQFVMEAGVRGFVLNGATGEYCLTSARELGDMLLLARNIVGDSTTLLAAVGGASMLQTVLRLVAAHASGADALLLPMPYFFPYEQQDLEAYSKQVVNHASLPMLLYNLPEFTTRIEPETARRLIEETRIVGIKDSSGSLDTVRLLTKSLPQANRVIGNDAALHSAMVEGLCDGVVSGVASVLPELMLAFYAAAKESPLGERTLTLKSAVDTVLAWLGRFPVPWGLKVIAGERGFMTPDFALPLSAQRLDDAKEFAAWFRANRTMLLAESSLEVKMPAAL